MSWNRIAGIWKQLKGRARRRWGRPTEDPVSEWHHPGTSEKQLAEWLARQHKVDPLHK